MAGLLNTTTTQTGSPTTTNPNDPATAILPGGVTPATPAPTPTPTITQSTKNQPSMTVSSTNTLTGPASTQAPGVTDAQQNALNFAINAYNQQDGMGLMKGSTGSGSGTDTLPGGATGNLAFNELGASGDTINSTTPPPASTTPGITQQQKTGTTTDGATTAATTATTADISKDFAADFGRPPAAAGIAAYTALLQSNPNMTLDQLNAAIEAGAQTQDKSAMASLNGNGSTGANWTAPGLNPADVASNATTWNPTTNQWQAATTPPTPAPGPLPPSVTGSPFVPTSQGYVAAQDVVAPNQTVAGNFANVTDPNSVLMQQAAGNANQQSNARGLLNSSIGISAADSAMYTAALPIAQQDASTNATASLSNQQATNNASAFTSGAANTASIAGSQNATSIQNTNTNAATSVAVANLNAATTKYTANLSSQTQLQVQNLVNTNQQLLQSSTSAQNAYTAFTNQLSTITASTTMDQAAKDAAVATATTYFQNELASISANAAAGTSGGNVPNLNLQQYFPTLNTGVSGGQSNQGNGTPPPGEVVVPAGSTPGTTVLVHGIPYLVGQDGFGTTIKGV